MKIEQGGKQQMKNIKKLLLLVFLIPFSVNASLTTNFGLELSDEEVEHFRNLGFVDEQLLFVDDETYNKYINVNGILVAQDIKYYKTVYYADNSLKYSLNSIRSMDIEPLSYTYEITKEEYYSNSDNKITTSSVDSEPTETNMKKMVTSLSYIPAKKQYYALNYLKWKSLPKNRDRDIIAMTNNNAVAEPVAGSYELNLYVSRYDECKLIGYSEKINETKKANWKKGPTGAAGIFDFPENKVQSKSYDEKKGVPYDCNTPRFKHGKKGTFKYNKPVDGFSLSLGYNLSKVSKAPISVYGIYKHKKIELFGEPTISISATGISLSGTFASKYDNMDDTHVRIENPKW